MVGLYRCGAEVATIHSIQSSEVFLWKIKRLQAKLANKDAVEADSFSTRIEGYLEQLAKNEIIEMSNLEKLADDIELAITGVGNDASEALLGTAEALEDAAEGKLSGVEANVAAAEILELASGQSDDLQEPGQTDLGTERSGQIGEELTNQLHDNLEEIKTVVESGATHHEIQLLNEKVLNTVQDLQVEVNKIESDDPEIQVQKQEIETLAQNILRGITKDNNIWLLVSFLLSFFVLVIIIFR